MATKMVTGKEKVFFLFFFRKELVILWGLNECCDSKQAEGGEVDTTGALRESSLKLVPSRQRGTVEKIWRTESVLENRRGQ